MHFLAFNNYSRANGALLEKKPIQASLLYMLSINAGEQIEGCCHGLLACYDLMATHHDKDELIARLNNYAVYDNVECIFKHILALIFMKERDYASAEVNFARVIELGHTPWDVELKYCVALHKQGKYRQTHHYLDTMLGEDPNNVHFLSLKGQVYFDEGNFEKSIQCYHEAWLLYSCVRDEFNVLLRNDYFNKLTVVAENFRDKKCYDKALVYYDLIDKFDIKPEHRVNLYRKMSKCCYYEREYQKAINYLKKCQELRAEDADLHLELAKCYNALKNTNEAQKYLEMAIQKRSSSPLQSSGNGNSLMFIAACNRLKRNGKLYASTSDLVTLEKRNAHREDDDDFDNSGDTENDENTLRVKSYYK